MAQARLSQSGIRPDARHWRWIGLVFSGEQRRVESLPDVAIDAS
jgi:hypothetical protein